MTTTSARHADFREIGETLADAGAMPLQAAGHVDLLLEIAGQREAAETRRARRQLELRIGREVRTALGHLESAQALRRKIVRPVLFLELLFPYIRVKWNYVFQIAKAHAK